MDRFFPDELLRFFQRMSPIYIHLAAAAQGMTPFTCRGYGFRDDADNGIVWVYILRRQWPRLNEYLRRSRRLAALMTSGIDNESYQLKGTFAEYRTLSQEDGELLDRLKSLTFQTFPSLAPLLAVSSSDCIAVGLEVDAVYVQTPGPLAGSPLMERSP